MVSYSCNCNYLPVIAHFSPQESHVFETMAFLTTVSLIVIFVLLVRLDRSARSEEDTAVPPDSGSTRR